MPGRARVALEVTLSAKSAAELKWDLLICYSSGESVQDSAVLALQRRTGLHPSCEGGSLHARWCRSNGFLLSNFAESLQFRGCWTASVTKLGGHSKQEKTEKACLRLASVTKQQQ